MKPSLLSIVGAAAIMASAHAGLPSAGAGANPRPNILVIVCDDLRWDALSVAGNTVLKTPNIDSLAKNGMRFRNAFVTTAICAVSRASILSGQYARRHGVNDFKTPLASLRQTYPSLLQQAGYYTGFIGKWGVGAGRKYFQACAASFDFWAGDMAQTAYWHERACNYITNHGTIDRTNFFCSCPPKGRANDGCGTVGPNPVLKDPVHAETEFVPTKVRSFLDSRDKEKPFCLSLSLKAPHGPWQGYAPRFESEFEKAEIPRRKNVAMRDALAQPEFLRQSLESNRGLDFVQNARARNQWFAHYYRLIRGVDFCIGEVLHELRARQLADNTVVIFTSDNGHFAGEHGFFGKWFMHEESLRVPLILFDPRLPGHGRVCDAMALNVDVAPTVLEFALCKAPEGMQGRSLLPLIADPNTSWREEFFYEHSYTHNAPPSYIEPSEGVRTKDWKYILWVKRSGPEREALFHLANDPYEQRNLALKPEHIQQLERMRQRHADLARNLQ